MYQYRSDCVDIRYLPDRTSSGTRYLRVYFGVADEVPAGSDAPKTSSSRRLRKGFLGVAKSSCMSTVQRRCKQLEEKLTFYVEARRNEWLLTVSGSKV